MVVAVDRILNQGSSSALHTLSAPDNACSPPFSENTFVEKRTFAFH